MGKSTAVTCEVCGIQINRKADLKRHMKVHAPNKEDLKYPCPYPGCTFRTLQKSNIFGHLNTHTGARPYKCQTGECKFRTSDRGSLTRHRKAYHGLVTRKRAQGHIDGASEAGTPSTALTITTGGSMSPVRALPDVYQTPLPELPQMLEPSPPLVSSSDSMTCDGSKSSPVALRTDVFMGYPWDNEQYPLVNNDASLLSPFLASGSQVSDNVPALGYTQFPATQQGGSQAVNLPAQPIPGLTSTGVSDEKLNDLFIQSDEFQDLCNSLFTPSSSTVYGGFFPTPPPSKALYNNFVSPDLYRFVDKPPMPSGSQFVGSYEPAPSILSGWNPTLNTFDFAFANSLFAAPEMGIHNQDVNQIHPYTTPAQSGGYPMH